MIAPRSMVSVGSTSRFCRSSARVLKIAHTSSGVEKYSRRSPGRCCSLTSRHACSSFSAMLVLEREQPMASTMSSALSGLSETYSKA